MANNNNGKISIVFLILAALAILAIYSSAFIVDQTNSAIVLEFGKPKKVIEGPGLKFKIPFIQQVVKLDNRILDYDAAPKDIVTKDKKTIVIDNFAKWRITDPLLFYQSVHNAAGAHARLDEIVYSELRVDVGGHNFDEIVSKKRSELMDEVTRRSDEASRKYGFEVIAVRIKRADLPEANEKAVYNRMIAERQRDAKKYRSEGAEEAAKIKSTADKDKAILLAEAYEKAQRIMGEGDAKALKIYADAFSVDPDFYQFYRTLNAYGTALKKKTTIVLTPDSEFLKFIKSYK
ncbi:MAG: protease modulator HflC [Deltaproteobacteria bacterium]|nr:protease modulator HflC [Deltaproteobacteria bacterium]